MARLIACERTRNSFRLAKLIKMIFFFFLVAFSGQLENAIWGPATCCMHIQLCHARCHVNFIYHDHAHARPNKTNAARKVEIIIKKTRTRKSSAKSCTNRNEIIEFSFPFYVFTSAASCRQRRRKVASSGQISRC